MKFIVIFVNTCFLLLFSACLKKASQTENATAQHVAGGKVLTLTSAKENLNNAISGLERARNALYGADSAFQRSLDPIYGAEKKLDVIRYSSEKHLSGDIRYDVGGATEQFRVSVRALDAVERGFGEGFQALNDVVASLRHAQTQSPSEERRKQLSQAEALAQSAGEKYRSLASAAGALKKSSDGLVTAFERLSDALYAIDKLEAGKDIGADADSFAQSFKASRMQVGAMRSELMRLDPVVRKADKTFNELALLLRELTK